MKEDHNRLGAWGEEKASGFLEDKGYRILDRNFKNASGRRKGEIDIIAFDEEAGDLVFVEVKSRTKRLFGETVPEENITCPKLRKLAKIAQIYLRSKRLENHSYRFDAISVIFDPGSREIEFRHIIGL